MKDKDILPPALSPFVIQWGELGSAWGIGRSAARIHGLLLAADRPLSADEIAEGLGIARSNVSMSMKDLKAIGLVEPRAALDSRKEQFVAVDDPVEMAGKLAAHRRAREFEPARAALKAAVGAKAPEAVAARLAKLSEFAELVNDWQDDMAGLSSGKLKSVLKAGATVADHLPSKKKKKK